MDINSYVSLYDEQFLKAILYSFFCFCLWIILPHLQFKYNLLSKLTKGDNEKACDFLAYFMIYTGTTRNHYINEAIKSNLHINYGIFELPILSICVVSMLIGLLLVAASFYRLGMRGMYFGDHFGFLFKEKITKFPYDYFENPQYVGTTAFFIGYSLFHHSPAGVLLTILINVLYHVLNVVEETKLRIFYPQTQTKIN
jgi:phosphatidylethanolamine N-methyltransferase